MTNEPRISVCVVDDHRIVLDGLKLLLESAEDISCAFISESSQSALANLHSIPVDIVLLDIELPEMDGIAFCKLLKERYPLIRVIALTMFNELSLIRRMIEAGADGYLLKNADREELLGAIRRVHGGKTYYSPEIADVLVRGNKPSKSPTTIIPSLSGREKQIVQLIMKELTSQQIADQLHISFNTVETHRRNIMHKLKTKNSAGIVRVVLEQGLLDKEIK